MIGVLVLSLILLNSLQGLSCRLYSIHYPGTNSNVSLVYSVVTGVATAWIILISNGFVYRPSAATVFLGIVSAFFLFLTYYAMIRATAIGSYSFQSICGSFCGTLIPLLISVAFYGERFQLAQIAGILLTLTAFVFFNVGGTRKTKREKGKKVSSGYLFYCGLSGVAVGIYNQLLSTQQILLDYEEHSEMVVTVYLSMAVICIIGLLMKNGKKTPEVFVQNRRSAFFLLVCCSILPIYMRGVLILFRHFSAAVFYVIGNSGCLALAAVYAAIIFKERFTPAKVLAVLLAVGGAAFLGL